MVGLKVLPTETWAEASGVVLVLSSTEEKAKRIESYLRNNGHPLRTAWISEMAEFEDLLKRSPPDLVLCENDNPQVQLTAVLELGHRLVPELPILALCDSLDAESTAIAMSGGLQDCVSAADPVHLRHLERVIIRELINHQRFRELNFARRQFQEYQSRHEQLTEGTVDAVAQVQEGILVNANPAFAALLDYHSADQLVGIPLIDLVVEGQQSSVKDRLRQVLKGKHNGEPLALSLRGARDCVDVKARLILGSNDGESVIEMLIRNERGKTDETVDSQGCAGFLAALGIPATAGMVSAAAVVCLDRFDELEDQVGVISMEEIANQATQAIERCLNPEDQLFRLSRSEIAMVARRADVRGFEELREKLLSSVSGGLYSYDQNELKVSLSGVIHPLNATENMSEVVQDTVNEARNISRNLGGNISLIGELAKEKATEWETKRIIEDIRTALAEDRLNLAYQAIASLEGRANNLFDVTVRMTDRDGNERNGAEFFEVAEESGLAAALDRWVASNVLTILTERSNDQVLFVKLSESTIRDSAQFVDWLTTELERANFAHETLVFELQEPVVQRYFQRAKKIAETIRAQGAQLAVEHYGMSTSSLQTIEQLPLDYLKFDSRFTKNFADKEIQRRFVELIEAAKQRRIKTIVSYVEDNSLMAHLWQMGVNFVQGFHVQSPEVVLLNSSGPVEQYHP